MNNKSCLVREKQRLICKIVQIDLVYFVQILWNQWSWSSDILEWFPIDRDYRKIWAA